jgi:tRNA 2-thiocytidine biosynthesis protein TtcA
MELPERLLGKVTRKAGLAISDFKMIAEGDRVLVDLSGGENSWTLLHSLEKLRSKSPVCFELSAVFVTSSALEAASKFLSVYCSKKSIPFTIESAAPLASEYPKNTLLAVASREGFNKIALGDCAEDFVEELLLSELFEGEIRSLPPLDISGDSPAAFIRPLCRVFRQDILNYAATSGVDFIRLPGTRDPRREKIKKLLAALEGERPGIKANLLSSLGRAQKRYLMV